MESHHSCPLLLTKILIVYLTSHLGCKYFPRDTLILNDAIYHLDIKHDSFPVLTVEQLSSKTLA